MTATLPLGPINTLAADALERVGWTQGIEVGSNGNACLTGALKLCSPVPGDWLLAREVYRKRDRAEVWNDTVGRTAEEVVSYLRSADITDADLADTFGPQWQQIVSLIRRSAVLMDDEACRLDAARGAARDAAWIAAWVAACDAAWGAARDAARGAARDAARGAAWGAVRGAARDAAWGAARALVVRDLVGQRWFTQEHYDTLTASWAAAIGPVHPDDVAVTA